MTRKVADNYKKYITKKVNDKSFFKFFRSIMPEIITRTTNLEGEKANKRFISSLFIDN